MFKYSNLEKLIDWDKYVVFFPFKLFGQINIFDYEALKIMLD